MLPCVRKRFVVTTITHAAIALTGPTFDLINLLASLRNVVVVTAGAARVPLFNESGSGVEQEDTTTSLKVLVHRVHDGCRKTESMEKDEKL